MRDALLLLATLLVCLLPGAALLLALRVRRMVWVLGMGPAASIGVATVTSIGTALVGLPFGLVTLGVVTAVLLGIGCFWLLRDRRRERVADPDAIRWRATPTWNRVALVAGGVLVLAAVGLSIHIWLEGLGTLATIPQEHDTIIHTALTAYIQRTGRGAPWEVMPADVVNGSSVFFYPDGLHLLAAVAGTIADNPIEGLNAVTVMLLGAWLAVSVAALTFVAGRRTRLGTGGAALAAGIAAVVVVGLYRPTISLATLGGVLPNAAMMALAPGTVAALLTIRRRDWSGAVAVGIACAGLITLHPSAAVTVGVTLVAWWIGDVLTKGGLRRLGAQIPSLLVAAVVAALAAGPTLVNSLGVGGAISGSAPDFQTTSLTTATARTLSLLYGAGTAVPSEATLRQIAPAVLSLLGVLAILVTRRGLGAVTAWVVWAAIIIGAYLDPGKGPSAVFTGFYYNIMNRVDSNLYLIVPVLAGLGVVLIAGLVARRLRRWTPVRAGWAFTAIVVIVAAGYLAVPDRHYANLSEQALASRYRASTIDRVTTDDQDAFDYLAARVQPGQRVMNSANDGSTYLYVEKDVPVVDDNTLGGPGQPRTFQLLAYFNQYPTNASIRSMLINLDVAWVFVNDNPPTIGAAGLPAFFAPNGQFTTAPGLRNLTGLPGLTEVYTHGSAHVYQLNLNTLRSLNK
jgi:hypothetical protein